MPNPLLRFEDEFTAAEADVAPPEGAAEGGPELDGAEGVELACV